MWLSAGRSSHPAAAPLPDTPLCNPRRSSTRVHLIPFVIAGSRSVSPGEVLARPNTAPSPHDRPTRTSCNSAVSSSHPSATSSPKQATVINADDMELVDVHSSTESSQLLDAETRYLPLHSELSMSPFRPLNMNAYAQQGVTASVDATSVQVPTAPGYRPSTAPVRNRLAANFSQPEAPPESLPIKPTPSDSQPQAHTRKRPESPVTRPLDFLEYDDSETEVSDATLELKLLKALLANRKTKKVTQKPQTPQKSTDSMAAACCSSSSPYRSQYLPDRYTSPIRQSLHKSPEKSDEVPSSNVERVLAANLPQEPNMAAVKIQAAWRGFHARHHDPTVQKVRQEIRSRRAEDHIRYLNQQLETCDIIFRQRNLYEQEKQLRSLQLDALKQLWKEVQSLQQWKSQVLSASEHSTSAHGGQNQVSDSHASSLLNTTQQLIETLDLDRDSAILEPHSQSLSAKFPASSAECGASLKEAELETACKSLQQQVGELKEALTSMSSFMFQGGVIHADKDEKSASGDIRLNVEFDPESVNESTTGSMCSSGGISLCVPHEGAPTAPGNLRWSQHGPTSVVLYWMPSFVLDALGQPSCSPVIGYRMYVNGNPKGMVSGTQTRAMLEGLQVDTLYKVWVRGVSALGDSHTSETVEFRLKKAQDSFKSSSLKKRDEGEDPPDDNHDDDDDDGGHDSPKGGERSQPSASQYSTAPSQQVSSDKLAMPNDRGVVVTTPKSGSKSDPHCDFVKERSPSDDSGYWTSPSTTILQQQMSAKTLPSQKEESVVANVLEEVPRELGTRQQSKRVTALLERLEQKMKVPTAKAREESLLGKSTAVDSKSGRRKVVASDIPMKAFRDSSIVNVDVTNKDRSHIPVFMKKSDRPTSAPCRSSLSDSEALSSGKQDLSDTKGSSSGSESGTLKDSKHVDIALSQSPTPSKDEAELHEELATDGPQPFMLTPKPPEGGMSPRKGLVRRNSLRRRHSSGRDGSETAKTVCESGDSGAECKTEEDVKQKAESPAVEYDPFYDGVPGGGETEVFQKAEEVKTEEVEERSRAREPKKKSTERRASSVGAIMNRASSGGSPVRTHGVSDKPLLPTKPASGIVAEKPPIGRSSREPSAERRRESSNERRQFGRRRTKSEQGTPSDTEDVSIPGFYGERRKLSSSSGGESRNPGSDSDRESSGEAAYAVVRKLAKEDGRARDMKKKPFSHKSRAGSSDLSAIPVLPDRPESPAPRADKRPTPNTPTQAPSSPRVRRSSSFSKALPDETLKAVKSQEMKREAKARHASAGSRHSPADNAAASNPTKPTIQSHRRTASSGQAHEMIPAAGCSPKRETEKSPQSKGGLQRRVSLKDDKLRAAIERIRDSGSSPSPQATASEPPPDPPKSYSPKLTSQSSTDAKPRKLGNKAADLFAKLQLRLSTGTKLSQ
ncbi:hypothetical protein CAPTEDRAFT_208433 [Capitella teleta]|uniref:Fibronectin type-III domain-containing protein n=1 Tax=Capitella teleta TaxID=283909 RepID=R7U0B4_CAPTE|nr:hypothetical protein CAPTEDRAFT_208433 [Capitella teleta]|eukprot:ELT97106.1 hypothetical protein CAPTEDRAFT_208433 [Capitella teleta]